MCESKRCDVPKPLELVFSVGAGVPLHGNPLLCFSLWAVCIPEQMKDGDSKHVLCPGQLLPSCHGT